ncbi:hypothetical protein N7448_004771 [Penicillium atrosanguineum]|uniref:Uncharacterized protein n=1 Tax=Penicillium atrosanguineum TaxID=1132637 RepID=A0A9W9PPR5_9EURO|nr:C6 transcription factor [Penicillium atrosanguineum]KAJ5125451.1 hypothetical protein N7526_007628 [Penicillium atrosanguineum]KAJ5136217.1 hypothetical protein N7448_004771 [Penicillium atrosanguineum]KAJ5292567.1 C6 transcription factor [Penicillium atrosanguineum]KAJ5303410.1 hypothetical protein N7476_010209 [Penicillium atrosanguineum]
MPLISSRRSSQSHANLPIALLTTFTLITALVYLQLIYAISWILRPFYNSGQEFPPMRRTIEKAERLTVNIILGIVPTSFYRSPPVSGLLHMHEDSAHRIPSVPRYVYDPASHTQGTTVLPTLSQCYPENSIERTGIIHHDSHFPVCATPDHYTRDSSVYDTVKKHTTGKQRISVVEMHQSQQATQTYQQTKSPLVPAPVISAPLEKSPAASFDGVREASMHSFLTETDNSNNSLTLRMSKRAKSRSTESYPGRFPVSDRLEYTNLATAELNFREKGTTFVRPFSDY